MCVLTIIQKIINQTRGNDPKEKIFTTLAIP